MRVVHHDQGLARLPDHLQPPRDRLDLPQRRHRIGEVGARGHHHTQHAQQIADIEAANQPALQPGATPWRAQLGSQPVARERHIVGGDIAVADAVTDHPRAGAIHAQRELAAECIVEIDDRVHQARPMEQRGLGGAVAPHVAVIVEMIARQIGEQRGVEAGPVDAPLVERMRGDFHRDRLRATRTAASQLGLQGNRIGRGVGGAFQRAGKAVAKRADDGGRTPASAQRLRDPVAARGLAIGAGHAGHPQFA